MLNGRGWALPPLALLLAFVAFNGCSSDDSSTPGPDGGGKDTGSNTDTGTGGNQDTGTGPGTDSGPGRDGGTDAGDAEPPATWSEVYSEIISPTCAGCHAPTHSGVTGGHLDMSTKALAFQNLVNQAPAGVLCAADAGGAIRVKPGEPDSSLLYLKVSSDADDMAIRCGAQMPKGGTALTQDKVDMIESWITSGAPNN